MANQKIIEKKQEVVNEIVSKLDNNDTAVIFEYQGLTVDQIAKLRKDLRDAILRLISFEKSIQENPEHEITPTELKGLYNIETLQEEIKNKTEAENNEQ